MTGRLSRIAPVFVAPLLIFGGAACGDDEPEVAVSIVTPEDGAQVSAGEPVQLEVDLQGGELVGGHEEGHTEEAEGAGGEGQGENVGHLHVFVDGKLQSMPESLTPEVEFTPGAHTVMVEFVDEQHRQLSPRITDEIQVEAA